MSVQTEVLTIEVAIEKTYTRGGRDFQAAVIEDVMEAAVENARQKGVILVRVGRVPNRKHSRKAEGTVT